MWGSDIFQHLSGWGGPALQQATQFLEIRALRAFDLQTDHAGRGDRFLCLDHPGAGNLASREGPPSSPKPAGIIQTGWNVAIQLPTLPVPLA